METRIKQQVRFHFKKVSLFVRKVIPNPLINWLTRKLCKTERQNTYFKKLKLKVSPSHEKIEVLAKKICFLDNYQLELLLPGSITPVIMELMYSFLLILRTTT